MIELLNLKRFIVVCGHYGCGKTNFSINLAMYLANKSENVTLVDFDIVNPYFRSSDYIDLLSEKNIKLISPIYANSNLDLPAISPKVYSVFSNQNGYVIFDVGGDDVGAKLLSRFSKEIEDTNDYDMLYIINKYRKETSTPKGAAKILKEIESTSGLNVTAIINNSHLQNTTTADDIVKSGEYADAASKEVNLPIAMTIASADISDQLKDKFDNIFKSYMYVKPPWF